jgi:hypothetical protein
MKNVKAILKMVNKAHKKIKAGSQKDKIIKILVIVWNILNKFLSSKIVKKQKSVPNLEV